MLLSGRPVKAEKATGWLIDYAGSMDDSLKVAWKLVTGGDHGLTRREVEAGSLKGLPSDVADLPETSDPVTEAARKAIMGCVTDACGAKLADALDIQTKHSATFMTTPECKGGAVGAEYSKTVVR